MGATRVKISRDAAKRMSARIQNGEITLRAAARHIRRSHTTLRRHLQKFGLAWQPAAIPNGLNRHWRSRATIAQIRDAALRINAGESFVGIQRELGLDNQEIRRLARRIGIEIKAKQRPDSPFIAPTRTIDLAYLAAFLDGEGCIGLPRKAHASGSIVIYNTDKPIMDWISTFGGFTYTRKPRGFGKKFQYGWHLNSRTSITACLTVLAPYMRVKRNKALAVLATLLNKPLKAVEREYPPA